MEYVRYCPKCGRKKIYRSLDSFRANKDSLLCRVCARKEVFSNKYPNKLVKLLEDTPEAYYWIGYLLADGHFYTDRIKFTQNGIDKISVENFKKYIEGTCDVKYDNKIDQASFSVMSVDVVPEIMKKFDIKSDKTYNPPSKEIFENMDIDLLAYLFIGFVDGDGNVTKINNSNCRLRIKVHSSWINILNILSERLFNTKKYSKINNQGYAQFVIGSYPILRDFKKKYFENIHFEPIHRKWDKIDSNFISNNEESKNKEEQIKELYITNYSVKDICKILNLKEGVVYKKIKKIKENICTH